jgi:hypothetical protein
MWKEMAQVGMNSIFAIDSDEVIKAQQEPLTTKNACVDLPSRGSSEEKPYTKTDFVRDLGKTCRRVKKSASS